MKPILRWCGGKRALAPTLVPEIVSAINAGGRYIEPFLGSGAVALELAEHLPEQTFLLNDFCASLMRCWEWIVKSPASVDRELGQLAAQGTDAQTYGRVRDAYNVERGQIIKAAQFLYLNATSFNGVYRENQKGLYNVPHGRSAVNFVKLETLQEMSTLLLSRVRFSIGDFEALINQARAGDVIYADSPYDGVYGDYTAQGFTTEDQVRLASALERAGGRGAVIFASNSDTILVRSLYTWARIEVVSEARNVAAQPSARVKAQCVLITNKSN